MQRGAIQLDGVDIAYQSHGDPIGRPVVLIHALASRADTWWRLATDLSAHGRWAVAPDLRGHGNSTRAGVYTFEAIEADLLGLLDRLEVSTVDLVGHSLGGHIASLIAMDQPGRVARLVLEDSPPPPPNPRSPAGWRRMGRLARLMISVAGGREYDRRAVVPLLEAMRAPDPDWWAGLDAITARTLMVSGGETSHVPPGRLADVAARIPDCRLVTVEGAGHRVHSLRPEEFRAVVLPFLTEADGTAG